jgi:hypothetical protein
MKAIPIPVAAAAVLSMMVSYECHRVKIVLMFTCVV